MQEDDEDDCRKHINVYKRQYLLLSKKSMKLIFYHQNVIFINIPGTLPHPSLSLLVNG